MKSIYLSTLFFLTLASGHAFAADAVSQDNEAASVSGAAVEVNGGDHREPPRHERGPPHQASDNGQMNGRMDGRPPGPPPGLASGDHPPGPPPPPPPGPPPPRHGESSGQSSGDEGHRPPPPPMARNNDSSSPSSSEVK